MTQTTQDTTAPDEWEQIIQRMERIIGEARARKLAADMAALRTITAPVGIGGKVRDAIGGAS
jgi:hypothetical protein